jgi:hypothetical protein
VLLRRIKYVLYKGIGTLEDDPEHFLQAKCSTYNNSSMHMLIILFHSINYF